MSNFPTRWTTGITPTVAAAAHVAGDALGGKISVTAALRESGLGGVLAAITIINSSTQTFEVDVFFFDQDFQAVADDAPFSTTDADTLGTGTKVIGVETVTASEFKTTANHAIATHECAFPLHVLDGPGTIFCQMVTRTAFTPGVNGITIRFGILKD